MLLLCLSACERTETVGADWPPFQDQLNTVFDDHKATLALIEREMEADGLLRMGSAILSDSATNPFKPLLSNEQTQKYSALLQRTNMFLNVSRGEDATEFELLIRDVETRLYLIRFVHTSVSSPLPSCAPAMESSSCGSCSMPLEKEWLINFDWFPSDPEVEAQECAGLSI